MYYDMCTIRWHLYAATNTNGAYISSFSFNRSTLSVASQQAYYITTFNLIRNIKTKDMMYKLNFTISTSESKRTLTLTGKMNFKTIKEEILKNFVNGKAHTFFLILSINGISTCYNGYYDKFNTIAVYMVGSKRRYSITEVLDMIERYDRIINKTRQAQLQDFV